VIRRKPDFSTKLLNFFLDSLALVFVWVLAFHLRFFTLISTPKGIPSALVYYKLIPFVILCWATVAILNPFERSYKGYFKLVSEVILMSVFFICLTYFYSEYRYSRLTLLIFCLLSPCVLLLTRWLSFYLLGLFYRKQVKRNMLILSDDKDISYLNHILFFVKKDCTQLVLGKEKNIFFHNESGACLNLFDPKSWQEFLTKRYYSLAVISLSYENYNIMNSLLKILVNEISDVHIVSDMKHLGGFNRSIENFGDLSVVSINDSPLKGASKVCKRLFDIVVSLVLLILLLPIFVVITILLSNKTYDSIFFRQKRMGLDGHLFTMYKFRSMSKQSAEVENQSWSQENDVRVTKIGKILRKFSLDELPQLFNVLRGDMSLVGPRPEIPFFVGEFRKEIPGYMLRHKVKAGLTGWAQVNGLRGDTSIKERINCDLYYIKNWSLKFDCVILFKTLFQEIFNPQGK
jgi:exopolysaccharide biosynthesis polyprenyl glycosylphosphotransferase